LSNLTVGLPAAISLKKMGDTGAGPSVEGFPEMLKNMPEKKVLDMIEVRILKAYVTTKVNN